MERHDWMNWAQVLKEKRLTGLAAVLLEGAGPLKFILSQVMLGFLPIFGQYQTSPWVSFAHMLENPAECRAFSTYLLEEKSQ